MVRETVAMETLAARAMVRIPVRSDVLCPEFRGLVFISSISRLALHFQHSLYIFPTKHLVLRSAYSRDPIAVSLLRTRAESGYDPEPDRLEDSYSGTLNLKIEKILDKSVYTKLLFTRPKNR